MYSHSFPRYSRESWLQRFLCQGCSVLIDSLTSVLRTFPNGLGFSPSVYLLKGIDDMSRSSIMYFKRLGRRNTSTLLNFFVIFTDAFSRTSENVLCYIIAFLSDGFVPYLRLFEVVIDEQTQCCIEHVSLHHPHKACFNELHQHTYHVFAEKHPHDDFEQISAANLMSNVCRIRWEFADEFHGSNDGFTL